MASRDRPRASNKKRKDNELAEKRAEKRRQHREEKAEQKRLQKRERRRRRGVGYGKPQATTAEDEA